MSLADMPPPSLEVGATESLSAAELDELCDAAEAGIRAGGGFGWVAPPPREVMERYWQGVLLVPQRILFTARLDRVIAGSAQLQFAPSANQAQAHTAQLLHHFVAPWARGHGLARMLLEAAERKAVAAGACVMTLDVRETQRRAIQLYETCGYQRFGRNPVYARIDGAFVAGCYFYKLLADPDADSRPAGGPA
jgi:ribosomal protein S18 acetylase RimI-like enzyme